jgi:hypothetical protein
MLKMMLGNECSYKLYEMCCSKQLVHFYKTTQKEDVALHYYKEEDRGSFKCAWNGNGPILLAQNYKSFTSLMDYFHNLVHGPWINFIHDHLYFFTSITNIHHS